MWVAGEELPRFRVSRSQLSSSVARFEKYPKLTLDVGEAQGMRRVEQTPGRWRSMLVSLELLFDRGISSTFKLVVM